MIQKKIHSVRVAFKGIQIAWTQEHNFQTEIVCSIAAIIIGLLFGLSHEEWIGVFAAIGLVLTVELLNTALEELCDMLQPIHDPHVAKIKDLAAAAVFISTVAAGLIGLSIFIPHLI